MDLQKKMKLEAELAYVSGRLVQIRDNMEKQGYSDYELNKLRLREKELKKMLQEN